MLKKRNVAGLVLFIFSVVLCGIIIYKDKKSYDQTGPVFQMDSELIQASVKDSEDALLKGVTATDKADGDVTDSIIIESISPFNGDGRRVIRYAAFDSDNHTAHAERELVYTDYQDIRIRLDRQLCFDIDDPILLDGITAEDSIDGDLTDKVELLLDTEIKSYNTGEFPARIKVINSAGDVACIPVTIEKCIKSSRDLLPRVELTENLVYVEKDSRFDEKSYMRAALINGTEYTFTDQEETYGASDELKNADINTINYSHIKIESNVDTSTPGCYEVVYYTDNDELNPVKSRLYVVVSERWTAAYE